MLTVCSQEQDKINNEGVWKEFKGSELRIARWLNGNFLGKFLTKSREAYPDEENVGNFLNSADRFDVMCKAMAGTVLTGWRKVTEETTGDELEFSEERAEILMRNNFQVFNFVKSESQKEENYKSVSEVVLSGE